jgi:XTP/dITP diphosphohydrolase
MIVRSSAISFSVSAMKFPFIMSSSSPLRIVLASRNRKKTREVSEILLPHGFEVVPVTDYTDVPEVVEDGTTFAENAAKKAAQTARHLGQWVIGEDSGLMVDALGGAPGIYSARYSGEDATDERNNHKLLAELLNVPDEKRGAGYLCSVALSDPSGVIRAACEGTCRGRILRDAHGVGGFGYDPYFLVPEYHRTFGLLSATVKHRISHRARAFSRFIPLLLALRDQFLPQS